MWFKRQQALGEYNIRSSKLQHRLQLHPREAFPSQVHGCHSHGLCYPEDAWIEGHHHHQGESAEHSGLREHVIIACWTLRRQGDTRSGSQSDQNSGVTAPLATHRRSSHRPVAPREHPRGPQHRRVSMLPQLQPSRPPIRRHTTRRKEQRRMRTTRRF
jgi:hypothetical protein